MVQGETVFHTGDTKGSSQTQTDVRQDHARKTPSHSTTINSNGNTWPIQHTRSDLTCFIAGQAAGHIYICWLLLPGQTRLVHGGLQYSGAEDGFTTGA